MLRHVFFSPFAPTDLGLIHTIAKRMIDYGLTAEDLDNLIKEEVAALGESLPVRQRPSKKPPGGSRLCPECGTPVRRERVNVSRCTNIGGGWTHIDICRDSSCPYSELQRLA